MGHGLLFMDRNLPHPTKWLPLTLALCLFSTSSLLLWRPDLSWHDQQRLVELGMLVSGLVSAPLLIAHRLSKLHSLIIGGILTLGFISSITATQPFWALVEWARLLGLLILLLVFAQQQSLAKLALLLISAAALVHTLQFLAYYSAAISTGTFNFQPDLMTNGFSNRRFFAQFHTLAIPVTLFWSQQLFSARKTGTAYLLVGLLAIQWTIAIHLGGRGQLIGLAFAHATLLLLASQHWRLLRIQAGAFALGLLLYGLMFQLAPTILNSDAAPSTLMRNSLSGRGLLWEHAWNMALEHPWLGAGPMAFAAVPNPVAAHPHQMVLQWLAEWGLIATCGALLLIGQGLRRGTFVVRNPDSTSLDAALWLALVSILVLAQVDGVLVMPYTGIWLAALAGIAMGRWGKRQPSSKPFRLMSISLCFFAAAVLAAILIPELPAVFDKNHALPSYFTGWKPRFWINGWIIPI